MRTFLAVALALVLLVAITGCGGTPEHVAVPDVIGLNEAEAVQVLEEAGLAAAAAVAEGATARPGTVITQDPEPGARVDAGSTVTLSVAREGY
jgi:eukaryotic-like serine/threonine-protein kinase